MQPTRFAPTQHASKTSLNDLLSDIDKFKEKRATASSIIKPPDELMMGIERQVSRPVYEAARETQKIDWGSYGKDLFEPDDEGPLLPTQRPEENSYEPLAVKQ
jgi:hypothetical protein